MLRNAWILVCAAGVALVAAPAHATFHFWDIVEVYSSADGSIQFIELFVDRNNQDEAAQNNRRITSNANTFVFGADLSAGNATLNKSLLLGSASYASLVGVPAPDFVIPDNFFAVGGDTLTVRQDVVPLTIDTLTFTALDLPLDGINSLNHPFGDATANFTSAPNSPTNLSGATGSIPEPALGLLLGSGLLALARRRTYERPLGRPD